MDILRAAGILPQVSKHLDMRDKLALSHTSRAIRLEIFSVFVRQARTSLRTFVRDIACVMRSYNILQLMQLFLAALSSRMLAPACQGTLLTFSSSWLDDHGAVISGSSAQTQA